jgi:hypothetical protein
MALQILFAVVIGIPPFLNLSDGLTETSAPHGAAIAMPLVTR